MLTVNSSNLLEWEKWFWLLRDQAIIKIWDFSVGKLTQKILAWDEINRKYRSAQLQIIKSEWTFSAFDFENLRDSTVLRVQWVLLDRLWFRFVPKTIWKSRPSLYIWGNITPHVDIDENNQERSAGVIMQLNDDSGYEFKLAWKVVRLNKGSMYIFNHSLIHSVMLSDSYEEWLNKWAKPFLAVVGSVNETVKTRTQDS